MIHNVLPSSGFIKGCQKLIDKEKKKTFLELKHDDNFTFNNNWFLNSTMYCLFQRYVASPPTLLFLSTFVD